jgi:hypothetical protein
MAPGIGWIPDDFEPSPSTEVPFTAQVATDFANFM